MVPHGKNAPSYKHDKVINEDFIHKFFYLNKDVISSLRSVVGQKSNSNIAEPALSRQVTE